MQHIDLIKNATSLISSLKDIFLTIFTFHYVLKTVMNGRHRRVESKMECSKYFIMCICTHFWHKQTSLIMMSLYSTVVCAKPGLLGNDNLPLLRFILGNNTLGKLLWGSSHYKKVKVSLKSVLGKGQLFWSVSKLLV